MTVLRRRYHARPDVSKRTKLAALGVVVCILAWRRLRPFAVSVDGSSMAPTLEPGDWLLAVRRGATVRPSSLVVAEHPLLRGVDLVKRLERVTTAGELWLVGDNPGESTDSRTLGPFSPRRVRGVVVLRYRPRPRLLVARRGRLGRDGQLVGTQIRPSP